ncbi:MAG: serine hydrolase [Solirubrobacteraceae bacterium]
MRFLGRGIAVALGVLLATASTAAVSGAATGWRVATTATTTTTTTSTTSTTVVPPPPPGPAITLHASSVRVTSGRPVILSGVLTGAPSGSDVRLYKSTYPYRGAALVRSASTSSGGDFSFEVSPDRDTRYGATLTAGTVTAQVQIAVTGRTSTSVRALALGQARVTLLVYHPRDLLWGGARIHWSFAAGAHSPFKLTTTTRSRKLSPYVVELSSTVSLPAGRFRFRACFHAPGDHALINSSRPPGCTGRGYQGDGYLPAGFPSTRAVGRASSYLARRTGRTAFAVIDSEGRLSGVHVHSTFVSASVVKAMLLVAYLRRLDAMGAHQVDPFSASFLYPMINVSDNSAATMTWSVVGDSGLYSVARAAGMTDFSVVGIWANAQISAADQARFFFEMDSLVPRRFVGYARFLLSTIAGYESWGIPAVARPRGYAVFFKGGWRGTGLGQLVHQVGRLERGRQRLAIAVMTDGDPSMGYGIDTIQGVTAALL